MRLMDKVEMFGMTMHDEGFADLVSHLEEESIDCKLIEVKEGARTGKALYWMDAWPNEKPDVWAVVYSVHKEGRCLVWDGALWTINMTAFKEWRRKR